MFRAVEDDSKSFRENMPLGQGLGIGLPVLGQRGKKAGSVKAKSTGKTSSSSKADDKSPRNDGNLTDTVEELAQQTRQTLEGMDTNDQEGMADKLVESIVKQFEELGSSQVLFSHPLVICMPLKPHVQSYCACGECFCFLVCSWR